MLQCSKGEGKRGWTCQKHLGWRKAGGRRDGSFSFHYRIFLPRFPSHCTTRILSYCSQHMAKRRSRPSFFTTPEQIFLLAADQGWSPCLVWSSACPSGTLCVPLAWQERWQLSGSFWASPGAVWAILFSCFILVCVRAVPQGCPALDAGGSPLFWRAGCPLRSGSQQLCTGGASRQSQAVGGQPRSPIPGAPPRARPAPAFLLGCGCCGQSAAGGILSAAPPADPSPCPWVASLPLVTLSP